jgi:hypothetical protein
MTRHASKRDVNHAELRDYLRAVPGMAVIDVGSYAGLGCDLIVRWQNNPAMFVEIKASPKAPLTDSERHLKKVMGEYWIRAECFEDVLRACGLSNDPPPF